VPLIDGPVLRRTGPDSRPLARAGAAVSVGCALLHGLLLTGSPAGWLTGLHAAVVLGCLPCAVHLWRSPGLPAWLPHGGLALAMALVLPLAMAVAPASGPHGHMTMPVTGLTAAAEVAAPLLALLSLAIAAVAIAGGWLRRQISGASAADGAVRRVPQA
jgi:hypothetical protein